MRKMTERKISREKLFRNKTHFVFLSMNGGLARTGIMECNIREGTNFRWYDSSVYFPVAKH